MESPDIKQVVKEKYGQAALRVTGGGSSCCGVAPASGSGSSARMTPRMLAVMPLAPCFFVQ